MEEYENIKIGRRQKVKVILISLLVFLMSVIGVTYAYFSLNITGNEEASSVDMTTAGIEITYDAGPEITIEDIFSGASVVKTFSVINTGTITAYYDIKIDEVFGTFVNDELVYTLSGTNGGGNVSETIMPSNDGLLKAKISIAPGVTQTFTLTVTFKETGSNQNYNQTASYKGKIQIISPYKYAVGESNNIKLVDRIFLDNTAYPTNTSSKYVTSASGINYANPSDMAYDGYYVDEEVVNFTSSANRSLGTTFSYDATSGYFKLTGTTGTSQTYSSADVGKYTCYYINGTSCYYNPQELYKILEVSGSTVTRVERYIAKPKRDTWNGLGLYYTSTNTVGNQPTYFFRGHVTNNYVSFAGDLWRIVRINEDGSIRIIRQLNYVSAKFNNSNNDPMYVGYMFGTSSDPYANTNNSNIKTQVEAYYDSKLASLSSYLAPIEFCNDRSIQSTSGSTIYYGARGRLYINKSPQFACPNEARDLFTLTTSSRGNKKLTKSVGLLTQDEAAYAGAVYDKLSKYYLNNNTNTFWWTSSPYSFRSSYAFVWYGTPGGRSSNIGVTSTYGVRPLVSLKSDVMVSGGTGAANDPYVIATN